MLTSVRSFCAAAVFAMTQFVALGGTAMYWVLLPSYLGEGREELRERQAEFADLHADEFHDKATVTMARVELLLSEKRLTVAEAEAIRQELLEEFKDSSADFSTVQKMELSKLRGRCLFN